jgi:asparagine synthase (glutamine-hydrolysing)
MSPLLSRVPDGKWYKSVGHQLKWLHQASFAKGGDRYAWTLEYFYFGRMLRKQLYGPLFQQAALGFDAEACIRTPFEEASAAELIDRMLYADSCVRLPDHSVMILDRMTMAHALEARSPFLDHELAEFAAHLPTRLKIHGRSLRRIETKLAARYLPPAVMERRKQGFSSALPYMLKNEYQLLFGLFLKESHLVREGLFNQQAVERLLDEHNSGSSDHGNRLWLLLNSEVWYRMFIEGRSVDDIFGIIQEAQPDRVLSAV